MADTKKKTNKSPSSSSKKYSDRGRDMINSHRKLAAHIKHLKKAAERADRNAEARAARKTTERAQVRALNRKTKVVMGMIDPLRVSRKVPVVTAK